MVGTLTKEQIENILQSQSVCRFACSVNNRPYVVPITYVYDGEYIYGQTTVGKKLRICRKNPNVCLQIDIINSSTHWQSVLVFGKFEELTKEKAAEKRDLLFSRILTLMTVGSQHTFGTEEEKIIEPGGRYKAVMFRVMIKEKTGRYESMLMS